MTTEKRFRDIGEFRAETEGDTIRVAGYAAVFDSETDLGGFREVIRPGAFRDHLEDDVRFLINHDGLPLARTTSGTLKLREDERGLMVEAELSARSTLARDLADAMERGDLSQMSFAFGMGEGSRQAWEESETAPPLRIVERVSGLFDVSPVTYPAYADTEIALRARDDQRAAEFDPLRIRNKNERKFRLAKK